MQHIVERLTQNGNRSDVLVIGCPQLQSLYNYADPGRRPRSANSGKPPLLTQIGTTSCRTANSDNLNR